MTEFMGNPIYHWSHLELQRGFGITRPLTPDDADEIFDAANEQLKHCSARQLMGKFNVRVVCTTDEPADDLHWHDLIARDPGMEIQVLPAFRPDKAINIEKPTFAPYIRILEKTIGRKLNCAQDVADALAERINYFASHGCLCANHGLDYCMFAVPDIAAANSAFARVMDGEPVGKAEADAFKTLVTICLRQALCGAGLGHADSLWLPAGCEQPCCGADGI